MTINEIMQVLQPLSIILAFATGVISFCSEIKKSGLFSVINSIVIISISIIFCSQILIWTYTFLWRLLLFLGIGAMIIMVILLLCSGWSNKEKYSDEFITLAPAVMALIGFLISFSLPHRAAAGEMESLFIAELSKMKVSTEMFLYLQQNIYLVIWLMCDFLIGCLAVRSLFVFIFSRNDSKFELTYHQTKNNNYSLGIMAIWIFSAQFNFFNYVSSLFGEALLKV